MIKQILYVVRAMWRVINGGWYVWRDAPTDIVRSIALLSRSLSADDDRDVKNLIRQANAEYKLRRAKARGEG